MSLRVNYNILNQKGTPAFYSDIFANRPAAGFAGRVFISTDTGAIYEDTGSARTLIADAGAGTTGTLQQVTTNGNTTSLGLVVTAGNVAIGTSTAGAPLDIHGTGTIAQFNGTGTNNAYVFFQNAGTNKWRFGNNYNANANSLDFFNSGLAAVVASFNANGSLLLNYNLAIKQGTGFNQVSGYSNIAADSGGFFFNTGGANNGYLNFANLTNSRSYTFPDVNGTLALTSQIPSISGTTNYVPKFTNATTLGNSLIYDTGTNIGIGTTSFPLSSTNRGYLAVSGTDAIFELQNSGSTAAYLFANSGNIELAASGSRFTIFSTNGSERMRISSSGSLLINTTTSITSNWKLQVNSIIATLGTDAGLVYADRTTTSTQYYFFGDAGNTYFFNSGNKAQINMTTGVYTPLSDINKKKDFENSTLGLNSILALKPTLYRMKEENNTNKHLGFIAQQVKEYIPQAYVESDNFIGLNYNPIVAVLVKAIQELNEKLERNNIN
jgi:hypothetical protein